jgi:predicted acetyltransferase
VCIELRNPTLSLESEFMAMTAEFRQAGEGHFVDEPVLVTNGFRAYLRWLEAGERGEVEGLVPWSAYWAWDRDTRRIVGVSSLRCDLSPWMAEYGGHVGYRVRPTARRRGIGTRILELTLQEARKRGIERALIVCLVDDLASQGVLRNNGALFEREVERNGTRLRRYWVHTDGAT